MSSRSSTCVRIAIISVFGAAACFCAHRFAYMIPLSVAWEQAIASSPDCGTFQMATDDSFFVIECGLSRAEESGEEAQPPKAARTSTDDMQEHVDIGAVLLSM